MPSAMSMKLQMLLPDYLSVHDVADLWSRKKVPKVGLDASHPTTGGVYRARWPE